MKASELISKVFKLCIEDYSISHENALYRLLSKIEKDHPCVVDDLFFGSIDVSAVYRGGANENSPTREIIHIDATVPLEEGSQSLDSE